MSGLLWTGEGRLRLLWRLLAYMGAAVVTLLAVGLVLPPGILAGPAAMLAGGLAGGVLLLANDGRGPGALGFYLDRTAAPEAARGLALGVLVGLVTVGVIAAVGGMRWSVESGTIAAWVTGAVTSALFFLIPAAAEEAVLRGYPLQALAEAWGPAWALAITSLAFGALHLANPNVTLLGVLTVVAAGVFLGVLYLKTASLWWATGAHVGWNWAHGYLTDVPVSGLDLMDAPFYEGLSRGPDWLGGGSFGPEGSVVAPLILLGAAAICWKSSWLRPSRAALRARPLAFAGALGRSDIQE